MSSVKKFLSGAMALTLLAGAGAAGAQPQRHDDRSERRVQDARQDVREARQDLKEARRDNRQDNRAERRAERRYAAARYQAPRGMQYRRYRAGERLPPQFRERAYIVDHRRYALAAPPRGYQYVRVGNDVVLTAIATGVITSLVMDLFR
jgi:Ni/Co efflux regulator RcnB